jgi:hypothetical protein
MDAESPYGSIVHGVSGVFPTIATTPWFNLLTPPDFEEVGFRASQLTWYLAGHFFADRSPSVYRRVVENGLLFDLLENERPVIKLEPKDFPWIVKFGDLKDWRSLELAVHPMTGSPDGSIKISKAEINVEIVDPSDHKRESAKAQLASLLPWIVQPGGTGAHDAKDPLYKRVHKNAFDTTYLTAPA